MGCIVAVLGIIYILSPIDFWPGIIDDLLCLVTMIICCAKKGINPFPSNSENGDSDDDGDSS